MSGFKVFPNEVEDVADDAGWRARMRRRRRAGSAFGRGGEAVRGEESPDLTSRGAAAFLHRNSPSYKVPKQIEFRKELPKTNVGKILRRALRDETRRRRPLRHMPMLAASRSHRVLAEAGPDNGSRRTQPSTTRSASAFSNLRSRGHRQVDRLGRKRAGRAGAAHSARPVSAQHVSRRRARLRHRSLGARGRRRRILAASTAPYRRHCAAFSICRSSIRRIWPIRNAASRFYKATGDADGLKWAEIHADIIRRFGRFPHRNAVLGRATHAGGTEVSRRRRFRG